MKIFVKLILAVALSAVSCTRSSDAGVSKVTLVAAFDGSKVQMSGASAVWNADDRLSVFYGSEENLLWTYEGENLASSGIIRGYAPLSFGSEVVYVVYPYDPEASMSGYVLTSSIPIRQTAQKESFDRQAVLMTGHTSTSNIKLDFANSFLALKLKGDSAEIDSIVIKTVGGEKLSGSCQVNLSSDEPEVLSAESDSVVIVPDGPAIDFDGNDMTFLVSIAPGTFKSGFHISVKYSDGRCSVTKDEIRRTLLPGHVHSIDIAVKQKDDVFTIVVPFLQDGHGYSPFVGITAEQNKAKVLSDRSFILADYPSYTLDFQMNRLRLVWGNNNGLELKTGIASWIKIPAVSGKSLRSVGMSISNKDITDVLIADMNGYEVPFTRKSALPQKLFYADMTSPSPETAYMIKFNSENTYFLTELIFNYSE